MNFERDEEKNQENIRKHGFDFFGARKIFQAPFVIDLDLRTDYGEDRWIVIGPFSTRYDLERQRELPLDKQVPDVLIEKEEIALHKRIKEMRDESFAHSDARSHLFEGFDYSNHFPFFKPELPLSQPETSLLATMIQKWINHLDTQIAKFKESRSRIS